MKCTDHSSLTGILIGEEYNFFLGVAVFKVYLVYQVLFILKKRKRRNYVMSSCFSLFVCLYVFQFLNT
jgi:hypothetical protein